VYQKKFWLLKERNNIQFSNNLNCNKRAKEIEVLIIQGAKMKNYSVIKVDQALI